MWTPERIKAFRKARRESQQAFADRLGVARPTISEWENGKVAVSDMGAAALDALARGPRDTSRDYERGVLYACEAMSETIARLLREQREADEATIKQTAKAMLAGLVPAAAASHPETPPAGRRTASRRRTGHDE